MLDEFERDAARFPSPCRAVQRFAPGHLINCTTHFPVARVQYTANPQYACADGGLTAGKGQAAW